MTAAQKRQAKSDAIKRELMELKTEIKQRGKMTIDERAEVIKSTVEKEVKCILAVVVLKSVYSTKI